MLTVLSMSTAKRHIDAQLQMIIEKLKEVNGYQKKQERYHRGCHSDIFQ